MFSGLKRALSIIAAMLTVVPWGIMQAVQQASSFRRRVPGRGLHDPLGHRAKGGE